MAMQNVNDNKILFDPGREDRSKEHIQSKRKSSKVWLIVVAIIVAATVVGVNVLTYYSKKNAEQTNDLTSQTLIGIKASMREIEHKVVRSGTIKGGDKEDFEYVKGIGFEKVYFKNGDNVLEGDIIGTADLVSLAASMENTRKMIVDLDKELHTEDVDNSGSKIKAPSNGRVKEIYAQVSDNVSDVVYEKGALLILSVDGKMACDLKTDVNIGVGTAVKGKLSDGTELKGRVAAYSEGEMKVTFSDKTPGVGDRIKVSYEGDNLGEAELYVNCPLKITSFAGKIKKIKVKVGDAVEQGDTLFTLTDDVSSERYNTLMSQREDLLEDLKDMLAIYESGNIVAEKDGIVRGLDEDLYEEEETPYKGKAGRALIVKHDNDEPTTTTKTEEPTAPSEPDQTMPTDNSDQTIPTDVTMPSGDPTIPSIPAGIDPAQYYALINGGGTIDPNAGMISDMSDPSSDADMPQTQYINDKAVLYSIEEAGTYEITIKVEDKDVIKMEEGMPCVIAPTALEDTRFEGKVTSVSRKGTLSGKKAYFKVTVSFDRIPELKPGMTAKVSITINSEPVLAVPIASLVQQNNKTYVYTTKDEQTGELGGLREITTGKSDIEYTEVTSGLSEGEDIYYLYYDTIDYSKMTNGIDTNLYF